VTQLADSGTKLELNVYFRQRQGMAIDFKEGDHGPLVECPLSSGKRPIRIPARMHLERWATHFLPCRI